MGYGLIQVTGENIEIIEIDVLKMAGVKDMYDRLHRIHQTVAGIIQLHRPTSFAIEAPFFGKNVQSMLKLGRAQGVAIAAAMQSGLSVTEYAPKKIKQSITGNGNADKQQVWKMLQHITQIKEEPKYMDASDALAVAICHHYQSSGKLALSKSSTTKTPAKKGAKKWEDFISQHPGRVLNK